MKPPMPRLQTAAMYFALLFASLALIVTPASDTAMRGLLSWGSGVLIGFATGYLLGALRHAR